jgi:hypothetical protein
MTIDAGFIVVRRPEFVGEHFGDFPHVIANSRHREIRYHGVDRDAWWDLDGLYYDDKLSGDEKALREEIRKLWSKFFDHGLCENLACAQKALSISNRQRDANEIALISMTEPVTLLPNAVLLGLDYEVSGFPSPVRAGIFTKPKLFPEVIEAINPYGLFESLQDLESYLERYASICHDGNLEIYDDDWPGSPVLVYRVP